MMLANKLSGRNTITVEITCLLNSLRNHALSLVTWHPPQKIKNLRPQIQLYRTKLTYFTMSSPNMNASSILRNQSSRTTSFSTNLSGMKTVFVGKDQHPVTIMQMAHVNDPAWKKAASFENLRNNAHSLLEAHSIADIMALIANEVPMDTGAAFQEAQAATTKIMDEVFNVDNLHPSAFLNSDGKTVKFTPTVGLKERPDDLTYFRFQCDLDGSEVDKRVTTAGEFNFQFCLRLPQHLFCVKDDTVETISVSGKKRGQAKSMVEFMTELDETYMSPAKVLIRGEEDGGEDEVGEPIRIFCIFDNYNRRSYFRYITGDYKLV